MTSGILPGQSHGTSAWSTEIRRIREALGLSQRAFATRLGVSAESYRVWDSGRRMVPHYVRVRAEEFARVSRPGPMALADLATVLGVSEMTLRNAVRSGRLPVAAFKPRTIGRPILRALRADGEAFLLNHYRRAPRRNSRRDERLKGLPRVSVDSADQVRRLRRKLDLTQEAFASLVGAAGKAVVYQWESGRRRPSPILWLRLISLGV